MPSVILAGTTVGTSLSLTGDTSGELQIQTNNGATTAMTLTTAGNVGIGTTTPAYPVDIVSNSGSAVGISLRGQASNIGIASFWSNDGVTRYSQIRSASDEFRVQAISAIPITLYTNNTERMRIDSSGNCGIGTSSPAVKLDVNKGSEGEYLRAGGDDTGNNGRALRFTSSTGGGFIGAMHTLNAPSSGGTIAFATNSTERMRIDSSGNVGIGTSSPNARLHVANAGNVSTLIQSTDGNTATLSLLSSGVYQWYVDADTSWRFRRDSVERMRIPASGNILIGVGTNTTQDIGVALTSDPDSHNAGTVPSSLRLGNTGNFEVRYIRNAPFNNAFLRFSTHIGGVFGGVRMTLDANGNLYPEADNAQTCGVNGARWSAIWAANGTIQTSDERQKTDIADSSLGLNFITALKPVSFKWKVGGNTVKTNFESEIGEDGQHEQIVTPVAGKRTHYGLLAQQVKEVVGEQDFGGYVYDQETDTYALRYDQFISPLIKAVQELKAELDSVKAELQTLKGA
jgi:hypothetical protein